MSETYLTPFIGEAEVGQPYPADTLTVTTPSGGRHLYFRMPPDACLRNTAGRLGWKITPVVTAGSSSPRARYAATAAAASPATTRSRRSRPG